jgi:hypothetical protein
VIYFTYHTILSINKYNHKSLAQIPHTYIIDTTNKESKMNTPIMTLYKFWIGNDTQTWHYIQMPNVEKLREYIKENYPSKEGYGFQVMSTPNKEYIK